MTFLENVQCSFNRMGFELSKHSPEIMLVAGVAGTIISTVLACRASVKAAEVLEDSKEQIDMIHAAAEDREVTDEDYSLETYRKDLMSVYGDTTIKLAKLYAPAVIIGGCSIASILGSNQVLRNRNMALAAAYATVDRAFREYRGRVVNRFGADVDRELRHDVQAVKALEAAHGDDKDGDEYAEEAHDISASARGYARLFTAGCSNWTTSATLNQSYLSTMEKYANDKLVRQGYLFLDEVYGYFGFRTDWASRSVGWIYDPEDPNRDSYVKFGYSDDPDFMAGRHSSVWLDFNVDGPILYDYDKYDMTDSVC